MGVESGTNNTRWEQKVTSADGKDGGPIMGGGGEDKICSCGQHIGWATLNTKSALTTEDPDFLLCTGPEGEAFPGQGNGSIQRPALLPNVMQDPGYKDVQVQPRGYIASINTNIVPTCMWTNVLPGAFSRTSNTSNPFSGCLSDAT